ncbi:hypothetical protein Oweho_1609 [Owenweeksia hongkongensis DSM 17368]|uniref:Uncharacterized protein n=1 Tax=Owenweeksia hongkongensis (strain DSM 17368 / CIP 108786 / JCM 12287 / NRRL B-23963 / UST20020801) TaxID=926562 RepID=G8QZH0_OWEHD|nr:hypothetical protein [Owenweeksia hongkongensis]AEV32598.1 hypothetical protein Oweho_1609 [Owenweeksia hongkongensis DSM 17368]
MNGKQHFIRYDFKQIMSAFRVVMIHAFLFCCLFPLFSYSQLFSKNATLEDLSFLKESIITYNPGVYRFNPDFDKRADSLIAAVDSDLDIHQYFTNISPIFHQDFAIMRFE